MCCNSGRLVVRVYREPHALCPSAVVSAWRDSRRAEGMSQRLSVRTVDHVSGASSWPGPPGPGGTQASTTQPGTHWQARTPPPPRRSDSESGSVDAGHTWAAIAGASACGHVFRVTCIKNAVRHTPSPQRPAVFGPSPSPSHCSSALAMIDRDSDESTSLAACRFKA
jgi:hypothetical protein